MRRGWGRWGQRGLGLEPAWEQAPLLQTHQQVGRVARAARQAPRGWQALPLHPPRRQLHMQQRRQQQQEVPVVGQSRGPGRRGQGPLRHWRGLVRRVQRQARLVGQGPTWELPGGAAPQVQQGQAQ